MNLPPPFTRTLVLVVILLGMPIWLYPAYGAISTTFMANHTFTVNDNGDGGDAQPGNEICATASGKCTLRAAIDEANMILGPTRIIIRP